VNFHTTALLMPALLPLLPPPAGGETPGTALREDGAAARFTGTNVAAFPFLHPDRIRDAEKRRPDDPE
jgi:DNA mismatch repair protein MSH6